MSEETEVFKEVSFNVTINLEDIVYIQYDKFYQDRIDDTIIDLKKYYRELINNYTEDKVYIQDIEILVK